MASSPKEHNGTIKDLKSFQQTKKLWSAVITGGSNINSSVMSDSPTPQSQGEPEPLTSSDALTSQVDHFSHKVARTFLKGTVPHSVLIDITQVLDRRSSLLP
ncbi:Tubulin beta chain (Beta tubulin) [Mucor velutinosus]|uniref:Tubulin beta chain (Beta tubulin) n=1 Tax=Mucor velutinosus TaxID=708070 RepID=A0AAN7DI13_9FUNG|nr:Tubulin beta chain (Beta tubulin) [Mucor velutinosus]